MGGLAVAEAGDDDMLPPLLLPLLLAWGDLACSSVKCGAAAAEAGSSGAAASTGLLLLLLLPTTAWVPDSGPARLLPAAPT